MNDRVFRILEFTKIKESIQSYTASSLGRAKLDTLGPLPTIELARLELKTVDEALRVTYRNGSIPLGGITDIRPKLAKASIGGTLSAADLLAISDFIYGGRRARQAVMNASENLDIPILSELAQTLFDARQTELEIRQNIGDDATVLDNASATLRKLRNDRRSLEAKARQVLESLLRSHGKYLQDPVIAMRGTSLCLPVRVDYKNMVPGVVRDYSSSGATVFVEPQAAVEASQKVQSILLEEEREIERILSRLSGVVAEVAEPLQKNAEILADFDAWFAKAAYAKAERSECPTLTEEGVWKLRRARHPLLAREVAVPLEVTLGDTFQLLVITGPNTGGKTVTLKTIGLLTLMAMSGCFIPTEQPSVIGWCDNIFVDIGDEQSIEQSLSTFSSHMVNIVRTLSEVTKDSLVLLDELGAGTDPTEGAALATAILEHLKDWGAKVVATTHYTELKSYAFTEPLAMNASVEFNVETLRPTYRLQVGVPGRSNALAIASRLGLSVRIIEKAQGFVHSSDVRVEDLIRKLELVQREADEAREAARQDREAAQQLREEYEGKLGHLEQEFEDRKRKAIREADEIVGKAKREANRVISELRTKRGQVVKDHELVELRKALDDAVPTLQTPRQKKTTSSTKEVEVGATVKILSLGQTGEVIEVSSDKSVLTVQLGLLRMKVDRSEVEVLKAKAKQEPTASFRRSVSATVALQLDIRGETVDDATPRIDKYLDDAVIQGLTRVTIIHGKGTGALRDGVRRYLSQHRQVVSWSAGGPGDGGDGATVVVVQK